MTAAPGSSEVSTAHGLAADQSVGRSIHLRPVITLFVAVGTAALILPLGQSLFEVLATRTSVAIAGAATQETIFTLLVFGALLTVPVIALTIAKGWPQVPGPLAPRMAGIGLAIGCGGLVVATWLAGLASREIPGAGHAGIGALLAGTLLVLFQAGTEEIYFRGWLQPALARAWGNPAGLLVAAAAFAGLHLLGGDRSLLTIVNLLLGGVLFGLLAQRSGGIALAAAAHFGWNWAESIGLGLDPNPGVGAFGAIHDIDIVGSAAWGGSSEGLNASIAMTFVLVALVIPAFAWRWKPTGAAPSVATPG